MNLRGRSVRELRGRGLQAARTLLELAGLHADGREPSPAAFARLLTPAAPGNDAELRSGAVASARALYPGFADPAATAAYIGSTWPGEAARIVERADQVLSGRFEVLGYGALSFGAPMDWQADPLSGRRAPRRHWSRIRYLDASVVGDHKVIWELSRMQHLVTLGQAWQLTAETRYAEAVAAHLSGWMDANPPKLGMNWASSLEVSFRAISWTLALGLAGGAPALRPDLVRRVLGILHVHARHLESHLSTWFSPNTHLTGEALGLVHLGQAFPFFRAAARWRRVGIAVLRDQAAIQVRPDGVYFEQATYYHRYTTDFYSHLALLMDSAGEARPEWLVAVVQRLYDHIVAIRRPDGTWPLVGDDDGGRLVGLKPRAANDFADTTALAGVVVGGPESCPASEAPVELAWLLGPAGARAVPVPVPADGAGARVFRDGGFAVLRDGTGNWLLFEAGPHGALSGGHAHADALAIEIVACGRPMVTDSGTGGYVGDPVLRDGLRHAESHATLTVGGESSAVPAGPFGWASRAEARLTHWETGRDFALVAGEHDGFRRLEPPANVTREVLFVYDGFWLVRDRVESPAWPAFELHFPVAPGVRAVAGDVARLEADDGSGLLIAPLHHGATLAVRQGVRSPGFGRIEPAEIVDVSVPGRGDGTLVTVLVPSAPGERSDARDDGRCIRVRRGPRSWEVWTGPAKGDRIGHDGAWCWVERDASGAPVRAGLINGTRLDLDGEPVVRVAVAASVSGTRVGSAWELAPAVERSL